MTTNQLDLDSVSILPEELSIETLTRELSLRRRPNAFLRLLMNALESKRQAAGMGWSRPWNKTGLNVFRTHTHSLETDGEYLEPAKDMIRQLCGEAPDDYRRFSQELLNDPRLMVFTFYHNHESDEGQYEGLTLSFGRRVAGDPSKRDRLDLIIEDQRAVMSGRVDGRVDRVRIHVCPWAHYSSAPVREHFSAIWSGGDIWTCSRLREVQSLYEHTVRYYHRWKGDESRQWTHWSARFIDYFGARTFIPIGTAFS